MNKLNQALISCCLIMAMLIGVRILRIAARLEDDAAQTREAITFTARELQLTLQSTQAVLASVRATTEAVRRSSASQLGYYEAIGRRTSQLLAESTILVRHTDHRLESLTYSTQDALRETQKEVARLGDTLEASADAADETLAAFSAAAEQAKTSLASAEIPRIADNLATASQHLARTSASAEDAMRHVSEVLAPTNKGFWRRLIEAFIPRPRNVAPAVQVSK
jgi:hypothetical protein